MQTPNAESWGNVSEKIWWLIHPEEWPTLWDSIDLDLSRFFKPGKYTHRTLKIIAMRSGESIIEMNIKLAEWESEGRCLMPHFEIEGETCNFFQAVIATRHDAKEPVPGAMVVLY